MRTIEKAAKVHSNLLDLSLEARDNICKSDFEISFKAGAEFAQQWISVEDELPETLLTDIENVQYSEHILLKVNGYDHPFIGYYMKANDDEFFEFVPESITNEFMQELITHWRPIDIK